MDAAVPPARPGRHGAADTIRTNMAASAEHDWHPAWEKSPSLMREISHPQYISDAGKKSSTLDGPEWSYSGTVAVQRDVIYINIAD